MLLTLIKMTMISLSTNCRKPSSRMCVCFCQTRHNAHSSPLARCGSTSEKVFRVHYPEKPEIDESTDKPKEESIVMHCAGHAVRSHMKALDAFQTMKKFTPAFCTQHQEDFPDIAKVRCHCHKRHSPQCGCFTPKFLVQARKNFNCCLKQAGKSAASFALRM